jgi:putative heme iron utilization protein
MDNSSLSKIEQAQNQYHQLMEGLQSIILGTIDVQGNPHNSYAPFVMDKEKKIYFLASELAIHTEHLLKNPYASVLFIEDESKTKQIFGRCRLNFNCNVEEIKRYEPEWKEITSQLENRFGEIVTMITSLSDFHLFKLIPKKGRFVMGFGAIYEINDDNLEILTPVVNT